MQEIKKRIVIASILKPVDDTRMYEKMGKSLADSGAYDLHIIGYPATATFTSPNITLYPSKPFKRLSVKRLMEPVHALRKITAIKPDILIISTHELLGVGVTIKLISKCKLLYDVQENYFFNILYTKAFPLLLRPFLALYVRMKEISFSPFIDYFLLAEVAYEKEMSFMGKRKMTIENKMVRSPERQDKKSLKDGLIHLLFTGTLSESTGIFRAIHLAIELHHIEPRIRLTIMGYSSQPSTLEKIRMEIQHHNFINLVGGTHLVPHLHILQEIQRSNFGIISYPSNPSTENALPTKLYEYLGYELPILLTAHTSWHNRCHTYPAAIIVDYDNPDVRQILHEMKNSTFYSVKADDVFWESDKLIKVLESIDN